MIYINVDQATLTKVRITQVHVRFFLWRRGNFFIDTDQDSVGSRKLD